MATFRNQSKSGRLRILYKDLFTLTVRYRTYFPRELQIRYTNECAARVCLSDLQDSRETFPLFESHCGLINILHVHSLS